jgi:serine/threonine protein kinase
MQENHWQRIETIFNEAALLPIAERETLVRRQCAGDEELYREVWRLVEDDTEEDEFLQEPIFTLGAQIIENDFLEMPEKAEFASYKLQKLLGRGGMGAVFLAQDTRLNRLVALKILPAAFAQDAERMRRFVQEAKAASALNHPNILTIYETGETDNTKYIASEYVEGETLSERLRGEPMNLKAALDVAAQIASALQAAHGAKIIHRDIKPDNVMIRPDGFVKLLDFGIAKLTEKKTELIDAEATTANKASTTLGKIFGIRVAADVDKRQHGD